MKYHRFLLESWHHRPPKGQLELFAAILVVATMLVVGYVLFLVDSGVSAFYKQKLGFLANQGAQFAAGYTGSNATGAAQTFVSALAPKIGMSSAGLNVQVTDTIVNGKPAYACVVSGSFPLIQGSVLPATISLSSSTSVPKAGSAPSIIILTMVGNGNKFNYPGAVSGSVTGNGNSVGSGSPGGSSPGSGTSTGNGNSNTGTGSVTGNGNTNTGSGNTTGNGNNTSGSGTTTGNGNTTGGSLNSTGNGNSVQ